MTTPELVLEQAVLVVGQKAADPFYRYRWQGRDLPSWSTIRAIAGIKLPIHEWSLRGLADEAMRWGPTIAAATSTGNEVAIGWLRDKLLAAAYAERDRAARLGTRVHAAVEHGIDPSQAEADIAPRLTWYRNWLARSGARILGQEYQVYNLAVGYGGTVDLLVALPDGSIWLVDVKSGKSVWGEVALQVTGYRRAEFVGRDDVVDEAMTVLHHGITGIAVLHLADDRWEFDALVQDEDTWQAFVGLHRFACWQHDHDDIRDVTWSRRRSPKEGTR